MDEILRMRQERAGIIQRMRSMVNAAREAHRAMTEEENTQYEGLRADAERLADDIVREENLRSLEDEGTPNNTPAPTSAPAVASASAATPMEAGIRAARFVKVALVSLRQHENYENTLARMYPDDALLRTAMTEGVDADGGYTVPENLYEEIIPYLRQTGVTRLLGAVEVPLPNGNLSMVRQAGAANFKWVGEAKAIGGSSVKLGLLKLNAKKLAGVIAVSNELLADSSLAADRFVREELINGLAEAEDITALYGTGSASEPEGVVTACATRKITANSRVTADMMFEMVGKMMSVKLHNPKLGWRIPGVLWKELYTMTNEKGDFIFQAEMAAGKICGIPFVIDNNIKIAAAANKKTQIFLGDWRNFIIGNAGGINIAESKDGSYTDGDGTINAFENDLTLVRAINRTDFGVRYVDAFVFTDGIWTADV